MFLVSKRYRDVIYYKAKVHLRSEASKTYLSFLWWILEPLISLGIYYLVFGVILQKGTEDFVAFLLIGLVTWQWFANSVSHCSSSINNNLALIAQVSFPKIILPSINIFIDAFKFFIVFIILLLFLWWYGFMPGSAYMYLPLVLLAQHLFNTAISNLVAAIVPFVPDMQVIIGNLLRAMMYLSGILYSIERLPPSIQEYFYYNPMAVIIDWYRLILMHNQAPALDAILYFIAITFALVFLSHYLMKKLDSTYPRVLMQK